jgi:hypothetical protein
MARNGALPGTARGRATARGRETAGPPENRGAAGKPRGRRKTAGPPENRAMDALVKARAPFPVS